MIILALVALLCIAFGAIVLVLAFNICILCSRETEREIETTTYYVVSGLDNKGNQVVGTYKANSDEDAKGKFIAEFENGEANEILCTFED